MKILFAASECVPFIKTGGLADVVGSLPSELVSQGHDARVILPKYSLIGSEFINSMQHVTDFQILFGTEYKYCGIDCLKHRNVTYYFVDNQEYFSSEQIYGDGLDEGLRFAFFCRAIPESIQRIGFVPDILHLNDWQTGLAAALLKTQYQWDAVLQPVRTVFSIHNLRYQGIFNWDAINEKIGLSPELFNSSCLEFYGNLSCMKAGIVFSDKICTVSESYAKEIQTPFYGDQLDGLLKSRSNDICGIMNGIDTVFYAPETDQSIAAHFNANDLSGKAICKEDLQKRMYLDPRPNVPIVSCISRLTPQKGFDLIERVLPDIMRMDLQLIFLGSGDRRFVDMINWATWRYPGQVSSYIGLNSSLANQIYAGSDMFLMPSQFEPCGLSQLISLRYGTVPIVRETGGLKDSIVPYNKFTDEGNGFSFANYNAHEMLYTIERAVHYYYDEKDMWLRMMKRGMQEDHSWKNSAGLYITLYRSILGTGAMEMEKTETVPEKKTASRKSAASSRKSISGKKTK